MLCPVGQHTSPLLPFVVPNLPHKPPLCCQLLLHPHITSAHYYPLCKCAHKQTHTTVVSEVAMLHPHIEAHTDNLARNHLTVCSTLFAATVRFPWRSNWSHMKGVDWMPAKHHWQLRCLTLCDPQYSRFTHVHTHAKWPPPSPQTHSSNQAEKLTRMPLEVYRQVQPPTL